MNTIRADIINCPMIINGVKRIVDEVRVTLSIYGVEFFGDEVENFEVDSVESIDDYALDTDETVETEEIIENEIDWNSNNVKYLFETIELDEPFDSDYWYEEHREMRA